MDGKGKQGRQCDGSTVMRSGKNGRKRTVKDRSGRETVNRDRSARKVRKEKKKTTVTMANFTLDDRDAKKRTK